jgi:hypothetical protein
MDIVYVDGQPFHTKTLTAAFNRVPFIAGRAGQAVQWQEMGVRTTTISLEYKDQEIGLLDPAIRGEASTQGTNSKAKEVTLRIPHYKDSRTVKADEIQDVKAFGDTVAMANLDQVRDEKLREMAIYHDLTLEWLRLCALKGKLMKADGTTELLNLYTAFGFSEPSAADWSGAFSASPSRGALLGLTLDLEEKIAKGLGGLPFTGIHVLCGSTFFKKVASSKEVQDKALASPFAKELDAPRYGTVVVFNGIVFELYRGWKTGGQSATPMIAADKAHAFPVGAPGIYKQFNAPADYIEAVNTIGLPRYSKAVVDPYGRGITVETQSNPLPIVTRPEALVPLTA